METSLNQIFESVAVNICYVRLLNVAGMPGDIPSEVVSAVQTFFFLALTDVGKNQQDLKVLFSCTYTSSSMAVNS